MFVFQQNQTNPTDSDFGRSTRFYPTTNRNRYILFGKDIHLNIQPQQRKKNCQATNKYHSHPRHA